PNDEPASVLLDKIRKEKAKLVKEGKLKKKDLIETPISKDEIPFEIPESWEWCSLGNVVSLLSGRDLTPQDYNDSKDGIPYITGASNFDGSSLIINRWTPKPVTISKFGDLLITCKGTIGTMTFNTIGNIHIARQVMAISPYVIDIKYIKYFLVRKVYELEKKAKSIIPGISREDILTALIPLPPLAEQHRIVAKIEELLTKIDKLKTK
ncbi:MAG: restriction endonuclease subunit S, partial [Prevotella sp.]|nr:restriction endonuclease subunit S [Prevotella sp.]